jgi:hypothetical protein
VSQIHELQRLARALYDKLRCVVDVPICYVGIFDDATQTVHVVWQVHEGLELPGGSFAVGSGFASRVIQTRRPLLIRRWSRQGPRVQLQYSTEKPGLPESSCTVPVLFHGRVLGVVSIQSYCAKAFNKQHVALLQALANQVAVTLASLDSRGLLVGAAGPEKADPDASLASASHAVLILDEQGKIVRVNSAARLLMCGTDASIVLGEPLDRIAPDRSPLGQSPVLEKLRPLVALLKEGATPRVLELEAGADRHKYRVEAKPFLSQHGTVVGGVIVFCDQRCNESTKLQSA